MRAIKAALLNHAVRSFAFATVGVATLAASVFAFRANAEPPWGPETPPFNLEVILRDVTGGRGFGHVKFRQPNDADKIVFLDTWVRDLAPNHSYLLQRAVDTILDGSCTSTAWLTLGKGIGSARGSFRRRSRPTTEAPDERTCSGIDAMTLTPVLQSDCYRFTLSL